MAELLHSITIEAKPKDVYAAVATQKGMRGWWTADTVMGAKSGAKAEFGFEKRAVVFRMRIEALEPGMRVALSCSGDPAEWAGTALEWTLHPQKGGATRLDFRHGNWKAMTPYATMCNSTWGELMYRLKRYVETGRPDPHWKK
jgi:uncharacterized protein YndB with AHSA1/START domain